MSVSEPSPSAIQRLARRGRRLSRVPLRRQRGVSTVMAVLCLGLAVAALGAIDIGNLYFARREMQRTADLAASAGAQTISNGGGCASATQSAQNNALSGNGLPSSGTVTVVCGRWDPSANAGQSYFSTSGAPLNAVQVTVSETVPYFFMGPARVIQAVGTAEATNIRSFSLTTSVATLSGGLINGLLNGLFGSSLNLSVLSYQGLATTQIKLGDLATAIGAGSMSQLLSTNISVKNLVSAMITAASKSTTLGVTAITDLGTIEAAIPGGLNVALGNTSTTNGLLAVALDDPQAAANATISLLDALLVAAEIAQGQTAINLGTSLNLSPLASVTAQAKIIQPPVIAVGEAGQYPNGTWRTSAHSAQVQIYLNVSLVSQSLNLTYLGLPQLVNISLLSLPIYIEAGDGTAYLQSTQCTTQQTTSQSTIVATTGIAALCIGGDASSNFTNTTVPTTCNQPAQLTTVSALGYSLINVSVGTTSPSSGLNLSLQAASTSMVFNGVPNSSTAYQSTNTNGVGSATASLLTQLASSMSTSIHASVAGLDVTALVAPLLSAIVTLLSPILSSLDALLIPLLQLLGVQIGVSTVHDLGLACGQAQLVY
ncbi:TadG family pilus assembly protein [Burkholderia sp. 4M9327F10]|uniref:TadG family pilus assembly protein n=1 Tax=Burkholderia sp. 4M9327F10 TaxID=2502223 RepID=UPI0010F4F704|nr:TadG family pilus assembly protein [Burkholderia sp. 4M9327F10]